MPRKNLTRYFFESYDYQTFGALYAVSQAMVKGLDPSTVEDISAILRTPKSRITKYLLDAILSEKPKLKAIADDIVATSKKRTNAAFTRWEMRTATKKPAVVTKVKQLAIEILTGDEAAYFQGMWSAWPKRSDGKSGRGERPKAELLWKKIIQARLATGEELARCAAVYSKHPNVIAGYVKNVTTFYALQDGLWREALLGARQSMKQSKEQS